MTAKEKELFDQKGKIWDKMNDVARSLKEGKELNEDEQRQFDAWDKEYVSIDQKLAILKRAAELDAQTTASRGEERQGNGEERKNAPVNFSNKEKRAIYHLGTSKGPDILSKEERAAFDLMQAEGRVFAKVLAGGEVSQEERAIIHTLEQRAQSVGTASGGGYSVPEGFIAKVEQSLKLISPFFAQGQQGLNSADIFRFIRTDKGNDMPMPTNDDTANVGELLGENSDAFANAADLTFGQIILKAYKYNAKPMKVSNELLNDSGVDLEGLIAETLATRIGRILNTHFTTGDNTAKPQGIVTGATAGKVAASATAITFGEIIDLVHSVDAAYRRSPSCRFMLHDSILAYLKKTTVAAGDGRPLWVPGFAYGAPDTIDGFPYLINNDMASSVAASNVTMLFGDMSKYMIRQVNGYIVKRLNERFADYDQTAWLMFARFDGRYANTAAIKKLTQAAA